MAKFIVVHGSIKLSAGNIVPVGGDVEMGDDERAAVDPEGRLLVTPEVFAALKSQAEVQEKLEEAMKKNAATAKPVSSKALAALAAQKKLEAQLKKVTKPAEKKG